MLVLSLYVADVVCLLEGSQGIAFRHEFLADVAVADLVCLFQPRQRITLRRELLPDIAIVVGGGDGTADGGIVEFLGFVQVVAAGVAGGMEVADVLDVVANRIVSPSFIRMIDRLVIVRRRNGPHDGGVIEFLVLV